MVLADGLWLQQYYLLVVHLVWWNPDSLHPLMVKSLWPLAMEKHSVLSMPVTGLACTPRVQLCTICSCVWQQCCSCSEGCSYGCCVSQGSRFRLSTYVHEVSTYMVEALAQGTSAMWVLRAAVAERQAAVHGFLSSHLDTACMSGVQPGHITISPRDVFFVLPCIAVASQMGYR